MIDQTDSREKARLRVDSRLVAAVVLVILLLLLLVLRCQQPQQTRYFVEREVLLSGPPAQIDAVVRQVARDLANQGVELQLVERIALEFLSQVPPGCDALAAVLAGSDEYVVDRYTFAGGDLAVEEMVRRLQEAAGDRPVRPEPNYLTSSPWSIAGSPWSIAGSPWSIAGSPWSIAGSPWSIAGSPAGTAVSAMANAAFRDQWAFGKDGIRLATAGERSLGRGVLVAIMDTSPFPVTVSRIYLATDPPFEMDLQHMLPGGPFTHAEDAPDIRDHGLFAAGLVHAVAPESEIRLVRVLDDTGQGDLQTLNRAIVAFIDEVISRRGTPESQQGAGLRGAVMNLSLGVHPPPDAEEQGLPEEISSLQTILAAAQCLDIVTVAAAGNDSAEAESPYPAQIPASWSSTIGVAASNEHGELACFSNEGEILAPGGDGGPDAGDCEPMFHRCTGDCPYALISLSLASPTGYRYWTGTSFSTPLVSGLAAAVVDGGGGWLPPEEVRTRLVDGGRASTAPDPGVVVVDVNSTAP